MYSSSASAVKWATATLLLVHVVVLPAAADLGERIERARWLEERLALWQAVLVEGRPEQVLLELEALGSEAEREARLLNLRGLALAALGRHREAVPQYEQGIRLDPSLPELHFNLATTLLATGMTGRALSEFEQTLELDPASVEARLGLGRGLTRLRRFGPALEALEEAARRAPADARVLRALAEALDGTADRTRALSAWQTLEDVQPSADSARRLGELLREAAPQQAQAHFDDCAAREPTAADCAEAAATLSLERGEPRATVERLLGRVEQLSEAGLLNLLIALKRLGDLDGIEAVVGAREPALGSAWGVVSLARRAGGAGEAALEAARRGLRIDAANADLENLLGVLLDARGDRDAARAAWQRALVIDAGHSDARANLEAARDNP